MAILKTDPSGLRYKGVYNKEIGDEAPIGTYHMADHYDIYEIQRSNNFEFIVTNLDGIIKAGFTGEESRATIENAQEVLRLSVNAASVPHFSQQPISVRRGNSELKYAGVPSFDSGSMSFVDYIGADTLAILMAWQNLSYNVETEKVGLASDYKRDAVLIAYSPEYQIVRKWKMHGCWISKLSEDNFSSDQTNSKRLISCTIEYDRAEVDTSEEI